MASPRSLRSAGTLRKLRYTDALRELGDALNLDYSLRKLRSCRLVGVSVQITVVPYDHPDAVSLIAELQQEFVVRYGEPDHTPVDPAEFAPPRGLFLLGYLDGVPVACGGWRAGDRAAELKRMYVAPAVRGKGLARALLAELERTALAAGLDTMILVTGDQQPEAVALYQSAGYRAVPGFGYYAEFSGAIHLGKPLTVEEVSCPSTP